MKEKQTIFQKKEQIIFWEHGVHWERIFYGITLNYIDTFPSAIIKREKLIFNNNTIPRDTKQNIFTIAIKMVGKQRLYRYCWRKFMVKFFYLEIC